jgi:hypothetical protein
MESQLIPGHLKKLFLINLGHCDSLGAKDKLRLYCSHQAQVSTFVLANIIYTWTHFSGMKGLVVSHNDLSESNTIHELNVSSASRSGRKVVVSSWLQPHNLTHTPPREWAKEEETVEGKNAIDMLQHPKHDATTRERRDP